MNQFVKDILAQVSAQHKVSASDILSHSKKHAHVHARHEFFYRLHEERKYSAERIAALLSREHSAVRYGVSRHAVLNHLPTRLTLDYYSLKLGWATVYNAQRRAQAQGSVKQ